MSRDPRQDEWHRAAGKWSLSLEQRGNRIRLFQNRPGGVFLRATWIAGSGRDVVSLRTKDRPEAERLGRALLDALGPGDQVAKPQVTLQRLWDWYSQDSENFKASSVRTQKDARQRAAVLMGYFGRHFKVLDFSEDHVRAYEAARRKGEIKYWNRKTKKEVRARTANADLVLLKIMLRWGTKVRHKGEPWLKYNPLAGVSLARESNPRRPITSPERFQATRRAMQQLAAEAGSEGERVRWAKMELALVLAEGTGRRLGSIRQLRWDDVDLDQGWIRWRAEADKKGRESVVPLPTPLADEIRRFRAQLGSIAGWVFGRETDGEVPMDRHLFDKWLTVAEGRAGLPKLQGGLWHPYRRKWATERKRFPLTDLAAAGGWKDFDTILKCYQQPDPDTLLAVMEGDRQIRDRSVRLRQRHPSGTRW